MKSFDGRVAAVTGAGSGIGRALAVDLASRGCHLALSDIDDAGLTETANRCEGSGIKVTAAEVDVADRQAMLEWADQVIAGHGKVNLIVNNAGVALAANIESMSFDDLDWLMSINFGGVVNGTKAFLPHLLVSGDGHVVNISSVFGLISVPGQSAYNAAKFAVRGFTDALRTELKIDRRPVSCTTVHPGAVRTNIVRNARLDQRSRSLAGERSPGERFERMARTTPEDAARQILRGVRHDRGRVVIGPDAKVIDLLARLPSGVYQRAVILGGRLANRASGLPDRSL